MTQGPTSNTIYVRILEKSHNLSASNGGFTVGRWHLPSTATPNYDPRDVALVAEYTTNKGPFGDDWFLVFAVTNKNSYFMTCSLYSNGKDEVLEFLRTRFAIEPKLTNGTEMEISRSGHEKLREYR